MTQQFLKETSAMRKKHSLTAAALLSVLALAGANRADAVELLISGNFETPGGLVGDVPGWTLTEFATDSAAPVNSADLTGGADAQLFLRAFEGGGPLHPAQGNFDDDALPVGDADGADFLTWQRNLGLTGTALPSQGDSNEDMDVDRDDLNAWVDNFGKAAPRYINARLTQTVPAAVGETYTFMGTSTFEEHYSGFVSTLGSDSPFGTIPSPTVTRFKMDFLDANGEVISSTTRDLRQDYVPTGPNLPGFPVVHPALVGQAPAGTVNVRVGGEALNMAWNGTAGPTGSEGGMQSAFFNDFLLTNATNPGTDLLFNGNLDLGPPDALDFWNQVENPTDFTPFNEILRTPIQSFSNHTPGGSRGVWLAAFFGNTTTWSDEPVDGIISQRVGAVAGASYTFSGWTKFEGGYSGGVDAVAGIAPSTMAPGATSPTRTEIVLEFLDINNVVIGSAVIDVEADRKLQSGNANDNQWRQHTLQAVAPAGTRFAILRAQMIDGVFHRDVGGTLGNQSAFFDDFSLEGPVPPMIGSVPEPSSLAGLAIAVLMVGGRMRRR
jgi:hypothetical protein